MHIFAEKSAIMSRPRYLIVVAAGRGSRMGGDIPKQFMPLDGRIVLRRTIEAFTRAFPDIKIVTVLAADWMEYWKDLCVKQHFYVHQTLVAGGMTRFHSIQNALAVIPDDAVVAVHDGVRPLVSRELIVRLFDAAENYRGAVPCLPLSDTLRCLMPAGDASALRGGTPSWTADETAGLPPRERLFAVQTPQIFDARLLKAAYRLPFETRFTDDGSVVGAYLSRHPEEKAEIVYLPGEKSNVKLTTPDDLSLAKFYLSLKND